MSPPIKKRKFVVLKRRPTEGNAARPTTSTPTPPIDDIYDLAHHVKESPSLEPHRHNAGDSEKILEKEDIETDNHKLNELRPASAASKELVVLSDQDDNQDETAFLTDEEYDSDVELQQAIERARKLNKPKENSHIDSDETAVYVDSSPELPSRNFIKKPKGERGNKVVFRLRFPTIDGMTWPSEFFASRSLVPFYEIEAKLIAVLRARCSATNITPPSGQELEDFIFTIYGSRIFRTSTPAIMGITATTLDDAPEVVWLNKEDSQKFLKRVRMEEDELEFQPLSVSDQEYGNVSIDDTPTEEIEQQLELTMAGKDKKQITVRVAVSRQFSALAKHYAEQMGVDVSTVSLFFDGEHINLDSKIEEVDVEDEDLIEVRLS